MTKLFKKSLSLFMCFLMILSCLNGYVFTGIGNIVAKALDNTPIAGDINGDGSVNNKDLTRLMKHIAGEDVEVVAVTIDPNGDGTVNNKDLTRLMKYLSGEDVIIVITGCTHEKDAIDAVEATCANQGNIAYWYCEACNKYFSDEEGTSEITLDDTVIAVLPHTEEIIPGYPATTTQPGLTEGKKCTVCGTITKEQTVVEISEYEIAYRHYVKNEKSNGSIEIVNDEYLSSHEIINPNPVTYAKGTGVEELIEGYEIDGKKVSANGYSFLGWYEKPEATANRVYSISPEATGKKILYGIWSKDVYTITYLPADSTSSTLPKVEDGEYTIDKVTSLKTPPSWPNLVWVGWSDEDGKIITSIPKGTTGDITLTANWMSKRSQTVPNTKYSTTKPAIAIDEENGVYAFTYEIGDIQNVPIQQIEEGVDGKGFNLVKGMTHEINKTFTQKIGADEATSVANTIANATTKSDSWTLSEDWNKSTSFSQEHSNEVSKEQSQKAAMSFSETGKYSLSAGVGGTEEHIDETGTSTKTTKKHELGVNYEIGSSVNVGAKADLKAGVTAGTPFKNASVEAGVSVDQKLGLDYKFTTETEKATHETHTDKTSSYWNVNEGFETSQTMSQSAEFAQSISQSIKDTYKYGETLDFGGSNSNTVSSSNTNSESREYSSSVTYSTEEGKSITVTETLTADADTGYYRKVLAANFRVFAVVIYDMKSNTFSTMTYSLKINDSEHLFTDYSTLSSFNDYENGVLPFEVPSFVGDYVYGLIGKTDGLRINEETGVVEGYGFKDPATGICYKEYDEATDTYSDPCDTDVIIPRYIVVDVSNNQKKIVPVTGINSSIFSGTTVTSVYLSDRITSIPDGAFENCASLKYVRGGTINTIGKNAFKNCTSLFEFDLPNTVVSLGECAFEGVTALTVNVSNTSVFASALNSGVKKLSVNLDDMEGSIDGQQIKTPANIEYFSLSGGGRVFNNVSLESDADTVIINNITINNYTALPLKLNSKNIELSFTTINANNMVMRADADNTVITLDGNNYLNSSGKNAILSKNVHFIEKVGSSASGKLHADGNILVYGNANGTQRVSFNSDEYTFIYLSQAEYENMLISRFVNFNANGGCVNTASMQVEAGGTYGELPLPTRDYYTFDGWYTEVDGGTKITADSAVSDVPDITLYAHWTENPVSDWVLASSMPSGAQVVSQEWRYTLREYTENSASSLSGWTKYDTKRTSWGATQGPVYTDPSNGSRNVWSEQYVSSSTTHYKYYHRTNGSLWGTDATAQSWARHSIDLTYALVKGYYSPEYKIQYYKTYKCSSCGNDHMWVPDGTYTENHYSTRWYYQEPVYTYYYYKDLSKVATSDPTGTENVSNVQKWVQYRAK